MYTKRHTRPVNDCSTTALVEGALSTLRDVAVSKRLQMDRSEPPDSSDAGGCSRHPGSSSRYVSSSPRHLAISTFLWMTQLDPERCTADSLSLCTERKRRSVWFSITGQARRKVSPVLHLLIAALKWHVREGGEAGGPIE